MRNLFVVLCCVAVDVLAQEAEDSHHHSAIEEIVVTSAFQRTAAETAMPVNILSGEKLRERVTSSIGETLDDEIGIFNSSFGPGVGKPVIRGQSGNRVKILQNGAGATDVANISPDHANGVDALLAERIEIIRGPSILLYGNGAIGGVVNVIDGRIPDAMPDQVNGFAQYGWDSVNSQNQSLFKMDVPVAGVAIHVDGYYRDSGNTEIPDAGIDGEKKIGNSDARADGVSIGVSKITDKGWAGFSYTEQKSEYGLPPGVHEHGHHDDEDDHDEDEHHDDEEGSGHEEEVDAVRIDMDRKRAEFRINREFESRMISRIQGTLAWTEYQHDEVEIFEDGLSEVGTRFSNKGVEARLTADVPLPGQWSAVFGTQLADTRFSATGEEAFIPASDISEAGIFAVAGYSDGSLTAEAGVRVERFRISNDETSTFEDTSVSLSASLIWDVTSTDAITLGLSRAERMPTVEELYSNVAAESEEQLVFHAATNLFEIGSPDLASEVSNNLEIGYRKRSERLTIEANAYHNRVDDYIYLQVASGLLDEEPIAVYDAIDARFSGVEARVNFHLYSEAGSNLDLSVFGDVVRGRFDGAGHLPRIPPASLGVALHFSSERFNAHFSVKEVQSQNRVSNGETSTKGYTLVSAYADYHFERGKRVAAKLFFKANNLLDEGYRNHTSLLKQLAPEPGRNLGVGLELAF